MNKFLYTSLFVGLVFTSINAGASAALAQTVPIPASNSGAGVNTSKNWAGYVASGGNVTAISGTWTVPAVASTGTYSGDATWVGIGGVTSTDLIQIGTQAIFTGPNQVQFQAFYETLPQVSQNISMTIHPGDSMTASLTEQSAGEWYLSLRDNTSGQSFQTTLAYNSSLSSAEWIEEMPSTGNNVFIPLDNFGTISFTNGSVVKNGTTVSIAGSGAQTIFLINSADQALATPSPLDSTGTSFTVTRTSATPTSSSNFILPNSGSTPNSNFTPTTFTHHPSHRTGTGLQRSPFSRPTTYQQQTYSYYYQNFFRTFSFSR